MRLHMALVPRETPGVGVSRITDLPTITPPPEPIIDPSPAPIPTPAPTPSAPPEEPSGSLQPPPDSSVPPVGDPRTPTVIPTPAPQEPSIIASAVPVQPTPSSAVPAVQGTPDVEQETQGEQTAQPVVGTPQQNTASTAPVSTPTSPRTGTVGPGSLGALPSGTFTRNQAASTSTGAAARAAARSPLAGGNIRWIPVAVMLVSVGLGFVAV